MGGNVAVVVLTFASGVLVARWLGPDGRGLLSALLVVPTLLLGFAELGVRQAAVYHLGRATHPDRVLLGTMVYLLAFSSVIGVGLSLAAYALIGNQAFTPALIALATALLPIRLATSYAGGVLLGKERIGAFNRTKWLPALLYLLGVAVLAGAMGAGVLGVVIASVVSQLAIAVYGIASVGRHVGSPSRANPRLGASLIRLGAVYALALFVINLNYKLDVLLLERLADVEQVGQYTVGVGIAELLWQIPAALGIVIFSRSANAKDPERFSARVAQMLRMALVASVVGGGILFVLAGFLMPLVYGQAYAPSASVVRYILPGIVVFTVFKVLNMDLAGRGRPLVSVVVFVPALVLNVVLNVAWIPQRGADGAALASTVSYAVSAVAFLFAYARAVGTTVTDILRYRRSDVEELRRIPGALMRRSRG